MPRPIRTFAYRPETCRPLAALPRVCLDCPASAAPRCQRCADCRATRRRQMAARALVRNSRRYRASVLGTLVGAQRTATITLTQDTTRHD